MGRRRSSPLNKLFAWVRRQSMKVKTFLAVTAVLTALVSLKLLIRDHNHFFVASEAIHAAGIIVLIYKLFTQKTCCGISLKTQEITAIFLAVRLYCSFALEGDIHTVLDFATLLSTAWVVYMIRFKLKSTYTEELDNMAMYYMVIPSAILAILIHPYTQHSLISRMLWAFCVYLESVSVLPQLRLIQNAKMVEPFTAHYVFALGVARFLGCAHWIIQVYDSAGKYLFLVGSGYLWLPMVLLSEIVQTFILADFCYYYIKSIVDGRLLMSLLPV
ncbi:uncharacterized protein LOC130791377 [Actinidia eriantha]|uniref:uncharacterized protein LOC130791377 n=1 Tax=Actinidia eriantha TaxID=165200 RepID=UPI00258DB13B|nr:uncharacterized protein LOC130791377 [Actinidia eriantha]